MSKRNGNLAVGGLLLAGMGYLLGILTAPKAGKETRKDIQKTAVKAKTEAEKRLKKLTAELSDLVDQATNQAKKLSAVARKELLKAVELATDAKDKARNVLSAFHEGESDNKELQKAVDDANKAVDHLKKYLSKYGEAK
jgi:gas vesicle protein